MESKQIQLFQITPDELKSFIGETIDAKFQKFNLESSEDSKEELLTVEETLKFLKCSKQALWNWRKNGILNSYRLGNRVYYLKSDIFKKLIKQD